MANPRSVLAEAPFLRLLIPLCLGVSIPRCSATFCTPVLLILFILALIILVVLRKGSFYSQPFWGALLFLSVFIFGQERGRQHKMAFPLLPKQQYFVVLDEYPAEKEKTFRLLGQLVNQESKIIIYLPKSNQVKNLKPGDIIGFEGLPELVENDGNPYEFDYRRYLNDRGIGYRIFLKENQFRVVNGSTQLNVFRTALIIRSKLIDCLHNSGIENENVHLIASIAFGARDDVDKETIQAFTNTGVIHVLAVSGMNVGFVYIILDFLFRFLKLRRAGYLLHFIIMLLGIWSYTLITGMSASILRAAVMFTFVLIGTGIQRSANIFNSLAVSAFLLIALDPAIIRDVGFQLSYAAVLSIVVIQPFIYKQFSFKYWVPDKIWLMVSVTLAAQIGTIPLTLHYFHQFPVYFLLANMVVIPLVTLILYLSFVVVFLSLISGFLASLVAVVLKVSVELVLFTVNNVESLPFAVFGGLYPTWFQLLIASLMVYLIYRYTVIRKAVLLQSVLFLAVLLSLSSGISSYYQQVRTEVLFFNIPGTRAMALTNGRSVTVIYDQCTNAAEKLRYYMNAYLGERGIIKVEFYRLSDSLHVNDRDLYLTGNFIFFKGMRLFVQPSGEKDLKNPDPFPAADLVWLGGYSSGLHNSAEITASKFILYRAKEKPDSLPGRYPRQKFFSMGKSVQLKMRQSLPGSTNMIFCAYFNQTD